MDIKKIDLYKILGIDKKSTNDEIIHAYNFEISKFKFLPFLTENQKNDIKRLNIAKFILTDTKRKEIYDKKFSKSKENKIISRDDKKINSTAICDRIFNI